MKRISLKLGIGFFIIMLLLEAFLIFFLHANIVDTRIDEELTALQARGNSHRDVLEKSYRNETIHHIALMETKAETEVVITNNENEIIIASNKLGKEEAKILTKKVRQVPRKGTILENGWRTEKYISTVSPYYIDKTNYGYVYMFKDTESVQSLISKLNRHFLLAALFAFIFMCLIILFLTKAITTPLVRMKQATEKISKGDFSVTLPNLGNDEMGELAQSIMVLSNDLKHLREERSEFLASISHELKTPLTYIKGYADMARRENIDFERQGYLSIIFEETEKLSNMLKDLFDLAKIDRNNFTIKRESVHLPSFLQTIYEKILPAFNEKNIQLQINCDENIKVFMDPLRLEQTLVNLLDNALKYSPAESTTSIVAKKVKETVSIEIKDEGYGIPEQDLAFIFERFYRVEKSRSRDLGGTGLGLAIVKKLIEAHPGGSIKVSSILNKGTTVTITLEVLKK